MALESYPFEPSPVATELQWSRMARHFCGDGVFLSSPTDAALKVTASGTTTVTVQPGDGFVNGFYVRNDAVLPLGVPTNFGNASPRVDLVVLRASQTADGVTVVYRTGGTTAPGLAADRNDVFEIPLAQVTVAAGATTAASSGVVDLRYGPTLPVAVGPGTAPAAFGVLRARNSALYFWDGARDRPIQLGDGPRCRAWQSGTGEVLDSGVAKDVILNEETYDTPGAMHATTGDPAFRKIVVPVAGVYDVLAGVSFDGNSTGERSMIVVKGGTIPAGGNGSAGSAVARCSIGAAPVTAETAIQCSGEVTMAAGDWLSLRVTQVCGGSLGLNAGSDRVFLQVRWTRDS